MDKPLHEREQTALLAHLRGVRLEAGLTQVQLAVRLHEPQSFVSKYAIGERRLDIRELRRGCAALGLSLADFTSRLESHLRSEPTT